MMPYMVAALAMATVCDSSSVVVKSSKIRRAPVVVRNDVVREKVIEVDAVPETQVVLGDDSEVLFFVSPEYRHAKLYPDRQQPNIEEIRKIIREELELLRSEIRQTAVGQTQATINTPNTEPEWQQPPPNPAPQNGSVVGMYCSTCHGGPTPKGQFSLEAGGPVDDNTFRKAITRVANGTMPLDANGNPVVLDVATKNALLKELIGRQ